MGGFLSGKCIFKGWRSRSRKKAFITDLPFMDSFQLFELLKKAKQEDCLTWNSIRFNVKDRRLYMKYLDESKSLAKEYIDMAATPCHYGGFRHWFVCPYCRCNTRRLHFCRDYFACRKCFNLAYPSQNENLADRIKRKRNKILGKEYKHVSGWFPKPKWMRQKTWEMMRHVSIEYEDIALLANLYSVRSWKVLNKLREIIPSGFCEMERICMTGFSKKRK